MGWSLVLIAIRDEPRLFSLNGTILTIANRDAHPAEPAFSALAERQHVAAGGARVQLARPADLVFRVADHLVELGNPANGAGQGEDRREQADRDADGALDDAGIEIHVRVELARDEILVLQRNLFPVPWPA